jgi:hypothetical protein
VSSKQRTLVASFESLHPDVDRRQALAVEVQARGNVLAEEGVRALRPGGDHVEGTGAHED